MENVKDVLDHKGQAAWSIGPDEEAGQALAVLKDKNIGALLVLDREDNLLGIFTERNFVRYCTGKEEFSLHVPVRDIMNQEVVCVNEHQTLQNCMILMTEKRIRHLPVVQNQRIIGIISIGDVVNACIHEKDLLIDQLEHYIAGSLY